MGLGQNSFYLFVCLFIPFCGTSGADISDFFKGFSQGKLSSFADTDVSKWMWFTGARETEPVMVPSRTNNELVHCGNVPESLHQTSA